LIFEDAPDPILAKKIMCAFYILSKGEPNVPVKTEDAMDLIKTMSLDELRRDAAEIIIKKKKGKDLDWIGYQY
jgi:hypothetical protein